MSKLFTRLAGAVYTALFAALFAVSAAIAEPNTAITVPLVTEGNGASNELSFDRNGRYAVFASEAQNLVPGQDTGGLRNVFLYDRIGGSVQLVSHVPNAVTTGGNGGIEGGVAPQISADGNWVVFTSAASNLVENQVDSNGVLDVFLWSRDNEETILVSRQANSSTIAGNAASSTDGRQVTLSDDGRYVVYVSSATNLVAGQTTNAFTQLYQFDRDQETTVLVSHAASSFLVSGGNRSELGTLIGRAMSGNGQFVVFDSLATDLASGIVDQNGNFDVYLWNRDAALGGSLRLLSRIASTPLRTGNALSQNALISADGKFVVFLSLATDLQGVTADTNGGRDVFRHDRANNLLELVSRRATGATTTANGASGSPTISAGGDQIAYHSTATNLSLLQNDDNGVEDVFLWRGGLNFLVSHIAESDFIAANGPSLQPRIGPEGGVGFTSLASNLVAGVADPDGNDAFYRSRLGAEVFLVSHLPSETTTGNNDSTVAQVLFGGSFVAFESLARDLVDGPINGGINLFHHGGLIMADGFESGNFTAWSQVVR
jgi:Tol biopolymer transport system component